MGLGRGVARLVSRSARDARVLVVARLESSRGKNPLTAFVMSYASSESMATTSDTASVSSASDNGASDGERRARASAEPASASPRSQAAGEDPDAAPPPARRKKTRRRPFPISVNLSNCSTPSFARCARSSVGARSRTTPGTGSSTGRTRASPSSASCASSRHRRRSTTSSACWRCRKKQLAEPRGDGRAVPRRVRVRPRDVRPPRSAGCVSGAVQDPAWG